MKYYTIEPEVAGGFGENAVLDASVRPPLVTKFHYEFDAWSGDPILETVATFIVTDSLKRKIQALKATGVQFGAVEISKSGEFEDFFPARELPAFAWLQVTGIPGKDDFGLSATHRLVVSRRVLELLQAEGMTQGDISEFKTS
jgi:hypothetical protein